MTTDGKTKSAKGTSGKKTLRRPCRAIVGVGAVIYRYTQAGQIAVVLIKKQGGYWTLPKGKLLPDEAPEVGVAREAAEETGAVGVVEAAVLTVSYTIRKDGTRRRKQVTYYLVRYEGGELRPGAAEKITRVRWASLDESRRRIKRGRVRRVVRAAAALLGGNAAHG